MSAPSLAGGSCSSPADRGPRDSIATHELVVRVPGVPGLGFTQLLVTREEEGKEEGEGFRPLLAVAGGDVPGLNVSGVQVPRLHCVELVMRAGGAAVLHGPGLQRAALRGLRVQVPGRRVRAAQAGPEREAGGGGGALHPGGRRARQRDHHGGAGEERRGEECRWGTGAP
jgi:hypothetical protein